MKETEKFMEAEELNEEAKLADKEKNFEKAAEYLLRAVNLCPIEGMYFYELGNVYNELKKYKEAVSCYSTAIEYGYKLEKSYLGRANAWSSMDENEKAIDDYTEVLKINENSLDARRSRGMLYNNCGEYEKAIEDFDFVLEKKPDDMLTPLLRFAAHTNLGMKEEAQRDIEHWDREWGQLDKPN